MPLWPLLGVALGTWVLATLDERTLTIVLTVWIAFYLVTVLFNLKIEPEGKLARVFSPIIAGGAGICQGAVGYVVHSLPPGHMQWVL